MRKTLTMALIGGLAVLTAACSSSQTEVTRPAGAPAGTVAHVGDTLDLKTAAGRSFSITLLKVIDPAQTAGQKAPKAGKRFVARVFSITNTSSHALDADANTDVNVIGATGHMYSPASGTPLQLHHLPQRPDPVGAGQVRDRVRAVPVPHDRRRRQGAVLPGRGERQRLRDVASPVAGRSPPVEDTSRGSAVRSSHEGAVAQTNASPGMAGNVVVVGGHDDRHGVLARLQFDEQ